MEAIAVNIIAKMIETTIEKTIDISLTPIIEYLSPLIIQYRGLNSATNAHDSGSISIDQKTPPSIDNGIKTKVPNVPTESQVLATIPTITPIAPNVHETVTKKNKDRK